MDIRLVSDNGFLKLIRILNLYANILQYRYVRMYEKGINFTIAPFQFDDILKLIPYSNVFHCINHHTIIFYFSHE